jgi:hypothetical protein
MPAKNRTRITIRAAIITVIGGGIFVIVGSILTPLVQHFLESQNPAILPTPTVSPSHLITPTPKVYFSEDFSSKSKYSWNVPNTLGGSTTEARIEKGKLEVVENCPSSSPASNCSTIIQIPSISQNNFDLSFDVLYKQLTNSTSSIIAIMFRNDPLNGNYYYAQFIYNGDCFLNEYYGGNSSVLGAANIGSKYIPQLNVIYHYNLLVDGDRFTLMVDGNKVVSETNVDNNAISPIFFNFYISRGSTALINIDNLIITAP